MHQPGRKTLLLWAALGILLAALVLVRMCLGETFGWPHGTVAQLRLFRVLLAVLVGAALAGSGVSLQALLRNPLAEPFILGLSTGAALGIICFDWLNRAGGSVFVGQHAAAVIGAVATMVVVYGASRRHGTLDPLGLLLVGVVVSTINGALIILLDYLMSEGRTPIVSRWMIGHFHEDLAQRPAAVWASGIMIGGGLALLWSLGRSMDAATFSDSEAQSLGVNLPRLRSVLFLVASALAAAGVLLAGPLAFVGFVCPHLGRRLLGPSHRPLIAVSVLLGAGLLLLADSVIVYVDVQWNVGQLPLGIFTAVVGGLLFLSMLRSRMGAGLD